MALDWSEIESVRPVLPIDPLPFDIPPPVESRRPVIQGNADGSVNAALHNPRLEQAL